MSITATVVADSISHDGQRITTMQLRYPRFIHAEFMTHRVFSRNASSSRAIPVAKLIEDLKRDPAMPVFWGSNKPGMQAGEELDGDALEVVQRYWLDGMKDAISIAESLMEEGLHKQIANRVLEPWAHINVVVTATEWDNFWELRCHPDAQPEMYALAQEMKTAFFNSTPRLLGMGEWHLPYVMDEEWEDLPRADDLNGLIIDPEAITQALIKLSVARCARVSYLTFDGKKPDIDADLALYDKLVGSRPLHASPAEHQATPDQKTVPWTASSGHSGWQNSDEHGNFIGWRQFRKQLEKQHVL